MRYSRYIFLILQPIGFWNDITQIKIKPAYVVHPFNMFTCQSSLASHGKIYVHVCRLTCCLVLEMCLLERPWSSLGYTTRCRLNSRWGVCGRVVVGDGGDGMFGCGVASPAWRNEGPSLLLECFDDICEGSNNRDSLVEWDTELGGLDKNVDEDDIRSSLGLDNKDWFDTIINCESLLDNDDDKDWAIDNDDILLRCNALIEGTNVSLFLLRWTPRSHLRGSSGAEGRTGDLLTSFSCCHTDCLAPPADTHCSIV